jgi:L-amino acid N-acyltransferase YncA
MGFMNIRPATSQDYNDIIKIYNQAVDEKFETQIQNMLLLNPEKFG